MSNLLCSCMCLTRRGKFLNYVEYSAWIKNADFALMKRIRTVGANVGGNRTAE
jgi:hypothetical protein